MSFHITNEKLTSLLTELGFEPGEVTKAQQRSWRHPKSGCTLVLPANKVDEAPRPADLVGIGAHLDLQGHLASDAFERFVAEGSLPIAHSKAN